MVKLSISIMMAQQCKYEIDNLCKLAIHALLYKAFVRGNTPSGTKRGLAKRYCVLGEWSMGDYYHILHIIK
jgi:hypothetical protein